MNTQTNVDHTASFVARVTKERVRVLGRGIRSKNKRHSPPQAVRRRKPTNALAMRLGRQLEAAQSTCTREGTKRIRQSCQRLSVGNWNVRTLTGKEQELVEEAKRYHLDIVGISSTKRRGSGTVEMGGGWKLFYSGVDPTMSAQAGVGILTSPRLADCVDEWIPIGGRVCILKVKIKSQSLCFIQVYAPNSTTQYLDFVDEVNDALQRVSSSESTVLLGDFNAHVGTDDVTWKGVIGRHGDADLNENGRCLLQLCCSNGLCIMNTFFQHRNSHKYTWYRDDVGQRSLIDFCIVSADLLSSVMDVRVKRGAELSTDHHLVICTLRLKESMANQRRRRPTRSYRVR